MLKHASKASSTSHLAKKPWKEEINFKCYHCESRFKLECNLKKHIEHKHKKIQKPEELRDEEVDTSLNMSAVSEERCHVSLILNDSVVKKNIFYYNGNPSLYCTVLYCSDNV